MKVVCATRVGNMKDPNPETRGTVGIVEMPVKELKDDEVLIKVAYCGICGSDPHVVDGCFNKPEDAPFGIGHEMSGVIAKLGKNATAKGLKVGDRVGGNFLGYCGKCYYCSIGQPEYCTSIGNEPCMAEYVVWNESQVCKLPDSVSLREGSLMEPLSIAVRAMDKVGMLVGKRVLVSGGGPIGQLCCQLAAKYGAAELTLSEPVGSRCELAKKIGVEHIINPITDDVYARAMEITATTMLVPATVQSRWMMYSIPLLLINFPKGMNPAKSVTTARNTRGRVMLFGASCGAYSCALSLPQKML